MRISTRKTFATQHLDRERRMYRGPIFAAIHGGLSHVKLANARILSLKQAFAFPERTL